MTALLFALRDGHGTIVNMLLARGADVDTTTKVKIKPFGKDPYPHEYPPSSRLVWMDCVDPCLSEWPYRDSGHASRDGGELRLRGRGVLRATRCYK